MLQGASHNRRDRRLARRAPSTPEEGRIITNVRGLVVLASMQIEDAAVLRGDAAVARRAQHVSSCDYYVDDDGDELGALSRRLRAAVRAAEAAVAGEEAGPAPDDNRAEARARRARYHSWWWDDADAAADSEVEEINSAAENDEDDGASTASSEDDGEGG